MKKEILSEINRHRELMGLKKPLLIEGGVDDLVKGLRRILSTSDSAADNELAKALRTASNESEKLDTVLLFAKNNLDRTKPYYKDFINKIVIDQLGDGPKGAMNTLVDQMKKGGVSLEDAKLALNDPNVGVFNSSTSDELKDVIYNYIEQFAKKADNVTTDIGKLLTQNKIKETLEYIRAKYAVQLQGGKTKRAIQPIIDELEKATYMTDDMARSYKSQIETNLGQIKDSPWKTWIAGKIKNNLVVSVATSALIGIAIIKAAAAAAEAGDFALVDIFEDLWKTTAGKDSESPIKRYKRDSGSGDSNGNSNNDSNNDSNSNSNSDDEEGALN
jgi:hypothetical protein